MPVKQKKTNEKKNEQIYTKVLNRIISNYFGLKEKIIIKNRKIEGDLQCPKNNFIFRLHEEKGEEIINSTKKKSNNSGGRRNNFLDNLYRCQTFIRTKTQILSLSHTQSHTHSLSDPTPHPHSKEEKKMMGKLLFKRKVGRMNPPFCFICLPPLFFY
jgi:hypothetical protein